MAKAWDNRIVGYGEEAPDQLLAHPLNARVHPKAQQEALAGVLREVGVVQNIIVNRVTNRLLDGHLRVSLALRDNQPSVPVTYVELSEAEEALILASLDPISAMAAYDTAQLDALLREVSTGEAAVQAMLAGLAEEHGIVPGVEAGAGGDEFDATPEDGPTRCQPGDLWIIGGVHRLVCGDSTDAATVGRLMGGERAAAVVTDSPYGIDQEGITNDDAAGLRGLFDGVLRALPVDNAVVVNFQSTRMFPTWLDAIRAAGHKFERMLWMYKAAQNTYPWRGWLLKSEAILVSTVGRAEWNDHHPYSHDCYYLSEVSGELSEGLGWHASVKPMSVITDIVQRVSADEALLFDPFLGSGTTLIAAHRTGRRCYGVELEPRYCDVILRRAEAEGLTVECIDGTPHA